MKAPKRLDFQRARWSLERTLQAIESEVRSPEEVDAIYRRRAEFLAQRTDLESDEVGEGILIFRLGSGRYGVPLGSVREVTARPSVAPAPGAPPEIAGLMQIRGEIRVVWNLRRLLGLELQAESEADQTALLLRTNKGEAGVLVDEVEDVRNVLAAERRPAPEDAIAAAWMTDDLVIVLNTDGLWPGESKKSTNISI